MKIEVIKWNGKLIDRVSSFEQTGSVTLRATTGMIQSIKELVNFKMSIKLVGYEGLSNLQRKVAYITFSSKLIFLHDVLAKLNLAWIEQDGCYDYYRSALEKPYKNYIAPKAMKFDFRNKEWSLIANFPSQNDQIKLIGNVAKTSKSIIKKIA